MEKKALIIRGGSLKGSFSVGVMDTFYRQLGPDYFDVIYSNSVGVMQQAFFASKQIDNMLKGWTQYVPGNQMFRWTNLFRGKPIMNVDYLIDLYQSEKCHLDVERLKNSRAELYCIVTDHKNHTPAILDLKKEDVFQVMRATCAVPVFYHKKVYINGKRYHDGSLTINKIFDQLVGRLLADGFEEVVIVVNRKGLLHYHDARVFVIEPTVMPLRSNLDTNRERILQTIEQGRKDALVFLQNKQYMHPVLEHVLARKGKSVSVNDGRKITLVLFGGTMAGVRGGGAMIALQELGLAHAFDQIYTISAGLCNASYLLADDTRLGNSIYFDDLPKNNFIRFWRLWKLTDCDLVVKAITEYKPLRIEKILAGKTKLFVRLHNKATREAEYLEVHDFSQAEFYQIMRAAISMHYVSPGFTKIRDGWYKDLPYAQHEITRHIKHTLASDATDILIVYNRLEQKQLEIPTGEKDRVFEIFPDPSWKLGRLEMRPNVLKASSQQMGDLAKKMFGSNEN